MRLGPRFFSFFFAAGISAQQVNRSGIHPGDLDTSCKPCTDFWRYVNGGWLDKNPIPANESSWGPSGVLRDANRERLRTILEAAAADRNAKQGSNLKKMGDFYASCMDTAAIDAAGIEPLQPEFDRIAAIQSVKDLNAVLASFQRVAGPAGASNGTVAGPFRLTWRPDLKDPSRVIAVIVERWNPGAPGSAIFSLPDRDYYLNDDQKSRQIRDAFVLHVTKMFQLAGATQADAEQHSRVVLALETALAGSVMTIAERRDPEKTYHLMEVDGLSKLAPNFDWAQLLREAGLANSIPINVTEPELLKKVNELLASEPIANWKMWLQWRVLQIAAPYLARSFADEDFQFENAVLKGIQKQPSRLQVCADVVDRDLGEVLGQAYVEKYFQAEAKRRMNGMVENLRAVMREELEHSEWMQPETKQNAIRKLDSVRVKIGYPDRWQDYSALQIHRRTYFQNIRAAWTHGQQIEIARIGKPVDRTVWFMTPPTVNAYSLSESVEVVFPAGILQPPFFDMEGDDAANYGAIGAVIGHELGHLFDDIGSKYDATGALKNWWTAEDRKRFEARAACVVEQFNTLEVGQGLHHNGKQVLGEALGDLGGLSIAYKAYKRSLTGKPEPPVMDGFTADQRFFIAFARSRGTQFRDEAMRLQLNTNTHPVPKFRAIGTLQNMPEFHRAFHCKLGDPMVRPVSQQCKLW